MSAKDNILKRLRQGAQPFQDVQPITERIAMVPMDGVDLLSHFIQQAKALSAHAYEASNEEEALNAIIQIIDDDKAILAWDFEHIPLANLENALASKNITVADPHNGNIRVGITGIEAALAATGSIVISAKDGKPRSVSLLPYVHVAVVKQSQIMPHLDTWLQQQHEDKENFRSVGNHVVITGASRTADIGMELVLGAHGPAELHLVIVP